MLLFFPTYLFIGFHSWWGLFTGAVVRVLHCQSPDSGLKSIYVCVIYFARHASQQYAHHGTSPEAKQLNSTGGHPWLAAIQAVLTVWWHVLVDSTLTHSVCCTDLHDMVILYLLVGHISHNYCITKQKHRLPFFYKASVIFNNHCWGI